jgi:hypothetical protein
MIVINMHRLIPHSIALAERVDRGIFDLKSRTVIDAGLPVVASFDAFLSRTGFALTRNRIDLRSTMTTTFFVAYLYLSISLSPALKAVYCILPTQLTSETMSLPSAVVVSPEAFCTMAMHAVRHKYSTVHGCLIGSQQDETTIRVHQAVPICHGALTSPLVESALGLLTADASSHTTGSIVGWYTAPMLLEETEPSPVALRMVASLESPENSISPVLLVLQNQGLVACLQESATAKEALKALGKDAASSSKHRQWLNSLSLTVDDSNKAIKATQEAMRQNYQLDDFLDHLEGPASASFPDKELAKIVNKT